MAHLYSNSGHFKNNIFINFVKTEFEKTLTNKIQFNILYKNHNISYFVRGLNVNFLSLIL